MPEERKGYEELINSIWKGDPQHPGKQKIDLVQFSRLTALLNGTDEKTEALKMLDRLGIKYTDKEK